MTRDLVISVLFVLAVVALALADKIGGDAALTALVGLAIPSPVDSLRKK